MPESKHYSATIRWQRRGPILVAVDVDEGVVTVRPCPICGTAPDVPCVNSLGVRMSAKHNPQRGARKPPRRVPCSICGTEFATKAARKYCSERCARIGHSAVERAYYERKKLGLVREAS